jgi:folate-dependent phosphoribosylglycinamide formyltransferase PurN
VNRLLIVSNDKLGRKLINKLEEKKVDITIVYDQSSNLKRVIKLITRGVVRLPIFLKMYLAELKRKDFKVNGDYDSIKTNQELIEILHKNSIKEVFLFRAGLIINKKVIDTGVKILNTHCARLPQYGGLASISRALKNKDYNQKATLHQVTKKIDSGIIFNELPYELSASKSYFENEEIAYNEGIQMLVNWFYKF